jgi:hypothetical protein
MSDQEIIAARVQTALDRGWQPRSWQDGEGNVHTDTIVAFDVYKYGLRKVTFFTEDATRFHVPVWEIIFNHDFARALWPEEPNYYLACGGCDSTYNFWEEDKYGEDMPTIKFCNQCGAKLTKEVDSYTSPWHMHLRNMVIADDPIKYLGDNS